MPSFWDTGAGEAVMTNAPAVVLWSLQLMGMPSLSMCCYLLKQPQLACPPVL